MDVDSESEIVVSAGATGAFYCACLALLNPRDEVILFEPYYGYHISTLVAVGAVPKYVRLDIPGWTFTYDQLEKVYTSKTRGIMLNTPANPSGKVFSKAELTMISDFAIKHDLFVFTDEIYEHFVYDGREHISPATLPGMRERTITISGFSKTYSITGWRIGYAICDKKWAQTIGFFNDLVYVCAPAPLQLGVAKGLFLLGSDFYNHISGEFLTKRNLICSTLANIGLTPNIPQGAYYILADISCLPGKTSKERAMYLLYATGVASVPGEAFYHDGAGENLARFCFAKDDETIKKACHKLRQL
jgi:aminotransferase